MIQKLSILQKSEKAEVKNSNFQHVVKQIVLNTEMRANHRLELMTHKQQLRNEFNRLCQSAKKCELRLNFKKRMSFSAKCSPNNLLHTPTHKSMKRKFPKTPYPKQQE